MAYLGSVQRMRGDPGFFSTLGTIAKGAVGLLTGGPVGAISAVASSITPKQSQRTGAVYPGFTQPTGRIGGSVSKTTTYGAQATLPSRNGMVPRGYHYAKDGSGRIVRNRRRNFANPRALNRAITRVEGFARIVNRSRKAVKKAARAID